MNSGQFKLIVQLLIVNFGAKVMIIYKFENNGNKKELFQINFIKYVLIHMGYENLMWGKNRQKMQEAGMEVLWIIYIVIILTEKMNNFRKLNVKCTSQ